MATSLNGLPKLEFTPTEVAAIGEYHLRRAQRSLLTKTNNDYNSRSVEVLLLKVNDDLSNGLQACSADYAALRVHYTRDDLLPLFSAGFRKCPTGKGFAGDRYNQEMQAMQFAMPDGVGVAPEANRAEKIGRAMLQAAYVPWAPVDAPTAAAWRPGPNASEPAPEPEPIVYREWKKRTGTPLATAAFERETANGYTIVRTEGGEWLALRTSTLSSADREHVAAQSE